MSKPPPDIVGQWVAFCVMACTGAFFFGRYVGQQNWGAFAIGAVVGAVWAPAIMFHSARDKKRKRQADIADAVEMALEKQKAPR